MADSFENVLALLVICVLLVTGGGGESQDNQQDCRGRRKVKTREEYLGHTIIGKPWDTQGGDRLTEIR